MQTKFNKLIKFYCWVAVTDILWYVDRENGATSYSEVKDFVFPRYNLLIDLGQMTQFRVVSFMLIPLICTAHSAASAKYVGESESLASDSIGTLELEPYYRCIVSCRKI